MVNVAQPVGAIPKGVKWNEVPQAMIAQLVPVLPGLPEVREWSP
jgi:hypothetical protein